ncbi:hypothetical protein ACFYKT_00330 [Cytobacillus sp. FJAT-53684]|uniref:Uncharacterized protein n=1 Tax=Cytobacillus mangrovibacter TaxID=3299024 RepID=A0ABW6JSH3_9BACI
MIEFFIDISNIPAEYSIYVSFLLGMMVKYIWVWNIEYHFIDSINNERDLDTSINHPHLQLIYFKYRNPLLIWITKCIKNKEGTTGDDPEDLTPVY